MFKKSTRELLEFEISDPFSGEQILLALYLNIWSFCAGWNRKAFRRKQLMHIFRERSISLHLFPLGAVSAFSTRSGGRDRIVINSELVDIPTSGLTLEQFAHWVSGDRVHHLRFALLHEIGHILLHNGSRSKIHMHLDDEIVTEFDVVSRDEISADIRTTRWEIEADFFACIAMVPDHALWVIENNIGSKKNQKELDAILEAHVIKELCSVGMESESELQSLRKLACYRVAIYRKYARAFFEISKSDKLKKLFKKPSTLPNGADAQWDEKNNQEPLLGSRFLIDCFLEHPLVNDSAELKAKLRESDTTPFEDFLMHGQKLEHWLNSAVTEINDKSVSQDDRV